MQNRFTPTDSERDLADDDLNNIVRCKEQLVQWLDDARRTYGYSVGKDTSAFDQLAASVEQQFDDLLYKEWHFLTGISQCVTWTSEIPTCEVLRANIAQKRRDTAAQRMRNKHTPPTSPMTLEAMGVNGFGNDVTGAAS